jgi:hypothetical protein
MFMYSFLCLGTATYDPQPLESAVKDEEHYQWFTFKGAKPVNLDFRGTPEVVKKGDKFGVRKSANGKQIRLIFPDEETRVFTLSLKQAQDLAKGVKA